LYKAHIACGLQFCCRLLASVAHTGTEVDYMAGAGQLTDDGLADAFVATGYQEDLVTHDSLCSLAG